MTERLRLPGGPTLQDLALQGGYAAARDALSASTGPTEQYRLLGARILTTASLLGVLPAVKHKVLTVEHNLSRGARACTGHRRATLNLDTALSAITSAEEIVADESAWRSETSARENAALILHVAEEVSTYHHLKRDLPDHVALAAAEVTGAAGFAVDAATHEQLVTAAERDIDALYLTAGLPGGHVALPAAGGVIEARLSAAMLTCGADHARLSVASAVLMPIIARFIPGDAPSTASVGDLNWSATHGLGHLSAQRGAVKVQFTRGPTRVTSRPVNTRDTRVLAHHLHARYCLHCQAHGSCPEQPALP